MTAPAVIASCGQTELGEVWYRKRFTVVELGKQ